jgi:hypothetical protein
LEQLEKDLEEGIAEDVSAERETTEREDAKRVFASLFAVNVNALTQEDIEKFHDKLNAPAKSKEEVMRALPKWLHDMTKYFNPDPETTEIPQRRPGVDHTIDLEPGSDHPRAKMHGLSRDEGYAVLAYIKDMKKRNEIRESKSSFASPVLVIRKPGGGLRICVDYRALSAATIKNRNAPPMIKETLVSNNMMIIVMQLDN